MDHTLLHVQFEARLRRMRPCLEKEKEGWEERKEKKKEEYSHLRALNERRLWGDTNKTYAEVMCVDENASRTFKKKKKMESLRDERE